jgi:predicted RND superfamily exporter protein
MTPRLDGGEVFPYLVIFIGLENLVVLTRAVTSSQAQKQFDDVRERVAHALRAESWTISKHLFFELLIVMFGFITYVPTIQEFCQLALIGILIDFFMQINFWLAVLSIDIRRFTVGLRKKQTAHFDGEHKERPMSLPMKMPSIVPKRQQQQQQQSQWARYRVLQRASMLLVLIWVVLIFYKSCLIVDLLRKNGETCSTSVPISHLLLSSAHQSRSNQRLCAREDARRTLRHTGGIVIVVVIVVTSPRISEFDRSSRVQ